jgi:hypothetical protein
VSSSTNILSGYRLIAPNDKEISFSLSGSSGGKIASAQDRIVVWLTLTHPLQSIIDSKSQPIFAQVDTGFNGCLFISSRQLVFGVGIMPSEEEVLIQGSEIDLKRFGSLKVLGVYGLDLWGYPETAGPVGHRPPTEPILLGQGLDIWVYEPNNEDEAQRPPLLGMGALRELKGKLVVDYESKTCDLSFLDIAAR